jgi:hypothetical protein
MCFKVFIKVFVVFTGMTMTRQLVQIIFNLLLFFECWHFWNGEPFDSLSVLLTYFAKIELKLMLLVDVTKNLTSFIVQLSILSFQITPSIFLKISQIVIQGYGKYVPARTSSRVVIHNNRNNNDSNDNSGQNEESMDYLVEETF